MPSSSKDGLSSYVKLAEAVTDLADSLPSETMELLSKVILNSPGAVEASHRLNRDMPHPHYADLARRFLGVWQEECTDVPSKAVCSAILAAAQSAQRHRESQSVELVWTGPGPETVPFRRTEQAVLQVLDSAKRRITLVSYAVYKIPNICEALVRAARRGVRINVIVETPDRIESQNEYSTLKALGDEVASCSTVFYWPQEERGVHDGGKLGILHVKCAAADGRWLFLSSANLTEYAFTVNMELGVLITGGESPGHVEAHFDRMISSGLLRRA